MNSDVLVTDFYEFSMAYTLFKQNKHHTIGYFDVFVRTIPDSGGYFVFNGLHKFIDYLENFKFDEKQLSYLKKVGKYDDDFIDYLRNLKLSLSVYAIKLDREQLLFYTNTRICHKCYGLGRSLMN